MTRDQILQDTDKTRATEIAKRLDHEAAIPGPSNFFLRSRKWLRRFGLLTRSYPGPGARPAYEVSYWRDSGTQLPNEQSAALVDENRFGLVPCVTTALDEPDRPVRQNLQNLRYSPNGYSWLGTRHDVSSSALGIGGFGAMLREAPFVTRKSYDAATIIASRHPFTYGDWVPEHLLSIASVPDFPRPLLLPFWIGARGYVERDLHDLGIEYELIRESVKIKNACVLHKLRTLNLMLEPDVTALRTAFGLDPPPPQKGSIVYFSRDGFSRANSGSWREYPSKQVGEIVEELGGYVVLTAQTSPEEYRQIAENAEIVIADHGAALFNLLSFQPRVVVEISAPEWWSNCFTFLSAACGAHYHGVIMGTGRTKDQLRDLIQRHLQNASANGRAMKINKIVDT